jgi:hypothetical protein
MTRRLFLRTNRNAARLVLALLTYWFIGTVTACEPREVREALPDWSHGYENTVASTDGGSTVEVPDSSSIPPKDFVADSFGIGIPEDITYPIRIYNLNTTNQPCAVKQGSSNADIECMIDMDELDLNVLGLKYDIIAPRGMCDFVSYSSYMFQNFPIGEGPKEVSWTVHEGGNTTDNVNAADGKPRCKYDYSWQYAPSDKAPNCCTGSYTKTVTDATTGKVGISQEVWGGHLADCYLGAAYVDKNGNFCDDGWPVARIINIYRKDLILTVEYEGLSTNYSTENVILANNYSPADHNNDMPVAFKGDRSQPYYEFTCLDDAEEIIARVRLVVREWNEEAQFDMNGDPDTEGMEPGWNTPINDIFDWADLTPGNQQYPRILPVRGN